MKKFGLILAAVAALALGSMTASQPAKADGLLIAGGLGWGYCHVTYKKGIKRKTPFCMFHDEWHKRYWK